MKFKRLLKKGLLGYQPIFFPNGLITGTGYQFFGHLRGKRGATSTAQQPPDSPPGSATPDAETNESRKQEKQRLGNLYVPAKFGEHADFDSECYYCVGEEELGDFVKFNLVLQEMYQHYALKAIELLKSHGIVTDSMIEVGSNTCLFPLAFAKAGVTECHGTDIVDYSEVVNLLSKLQNARVTFHHMPDDGDKTWKNLPKADLVWSYAVLLHQSNPLAHLTRLASLAKKAMFVMTLCDPDDWKSDQEMAIRYHSANAYYSADFPNCFDVTIPSPALLKYSFKRLGFSRVIEIPHPDLDLLDDDTRTNLKHWLDRHCFYLAVRDEARDEHILNDYTVSAERSPYAGENVTVHTGYHNYIALKKSRYYIVPRGSKFAGAEADPQLQSYSSLTNAMQCFNELASEKDPQPLLIKPLGKHNLVRFKNIHYLCPHGVDVDFKQSDQLSRLPSLDSIDKWNTLLTLLREEEIWMLDGVLVDFIDNMCVTRNNDEAYRAVQLRSAVDYTPGRSPLKADSHADIVRQISVGALLESLQGSCNDSAILHETNDGRCLKRVGTGLLNVCVVDTGEVISEHLSLEEAWRAILFSPIA